MKRFAPLMVAGIVGLAACTDHPTETASPLEASFSSAVSSELEDTGNHLVMMGSQRLPNNFAQRIQRLGGRVEAVFGEIGVAVVSGLTDAQAAELQADSDVRMVVPDYLIPLEMPTDFEVSGDYTAAAVQNVNPSGAFFFARQWHLRAIEAQRAWAAGHVGSPDVTVAILDTGLDWTHVDLLGRVDMERSKSFVPSDDALVQAFFPGAHPVADLHYHGTHVGATVSSNAAAAAGVTSRTTLIGVKVCNVNGSCPTSGVLAGIMYAADVDADVINMSLGGLFLKSLNPGFVAVINRAVNYANRHGSVVVVAAGNNNVDLDRNIFQGIRYPDLFASYCDAATTVCVSATGPTSGGTAGPWLNVDNKAPYSNFGRSAIDVAAPGGASGGAVWAACSRFSLQIPVCRTGNFIVGLSGTSMASPHAAGVAALLIGDIGKNRPGLVRQRLHQTADQIGQSGNHPYYGKGRINAAKAVGASDTAHPGRGRAR